MVTITVDEVLSFVEGWLALMLVIGGAIVGLFGHKLLRPMMFFFGFVAGTFLGYVLLTEVEHRELLNSSDSDIYDYAPIIFGVCVGFLTLCVHTAAMFTMGSIAGMILAQNVWDNIIAPWFLSNDENEEAYNVVFVVVAAVICGFVAIKFVEKLLKPLTAFIGSYMLQSGIVFFIQEWILGTDDDDDNVLEVTPFFVKRTKCDMECFVFSAVWVVLFVFCLSYQYGTCTSSGYRFSSVPTTVPTETTDDESDGANRERREQERPQDRPTVYTCLCDLIDLWLC